MKQILIIYTLVVFSVSVAAQNTINFKIKNFKESGDNLIINYEIQIPSHSIEMSQWLRIEPIVQANDSVLYLPEINIFGKNKQKVLARFNKSNQLKDKADYLLASSAEILSPEFTDIYRQNINELVNGSPESFMKLAFDYFNRQGDYMQSATFSMIKTSELEPLAQFVKQNIDRDALVDTKGIQFFDRTKHHLFLNFEDYYSRLLQNEDQKQSLSKLIRSCVVFKVSTSHFLIGYNGFDIEHHSDLTSYIKQDKYPFLNEKYNNLSWSKAIQQ